MGEIDVFDPKRPLRSPFQNTCLNRYDAVFLVQGKCMRRRDFIVMLGGAAALPLAASAQLSERVRRIGFLSPGPENSPRSARWRADLSGALGNLGWTDGRNLQIDYRWGAIDPGLRRRYARELIALRPEAILAVTPTVAVALLSETNTIPVVFVDGPEAAVHGFIDDWSHPGGNVTGFINFVNSIFGKWLQLLREIAPQIDRVAYLFNRESTLAVNYPVSEIEAAARPLKMELIGAPVSNAAEINAAIGALAMERRGGAIVLPGPFVAIHQLDIFAAANRFAVPTVYPFRYYVENGGLLSYGVDESDLYRGAASYIDRILRGAHVGNLPVQAPTKFELALNTKTAKAIGIEIPTSILLRADAVIE
jgi:ABC-type uncharacterized transport system substrate-binding protein